jgi:hypothetical protein
VFNAGILANPDGRVSVGAVCKRAGAGASRLISRDDLVSPRILRALTGTASN